MRKPSKEELAGDDFEEVVVAVKCWRRKSDSNLFWVSETNGRVYDKYIQIQDQAGIPVVTHRKQRGGGLGGKLLRLAVLVLSRKFGLPAGVAKALINLKEVHPEGVMSAVERIKEGDPRGAAIALADTAGVKETERVLGSYVEDGPPWPFDVFLEAVSKSE